MVLVIAVWSRSNRFPSRCAFNKQPPDSTNRRQLIYQDVIDLNTGVSFQAVTNKATVKNAGRNYEPEWNPTVNLLRYG